MNAAMLPAGMPLIGQS